MNRPIVLYPLMILAILGWWAIAFHNHLSPTSATAAGPITPRKSLDFPEVPYLTPLKRDILHRALGGDYALMARLIREWDIDAHVLESRGLENIRHLPSQDVLHSQILYREVYGRKGAGAIKRYLPQTFVSASFLIALLPPEQIVACPKGLRKQTQLFPTKITSRIDQDIDRYHSELLFLAHPEAAFISHYSHPAMITALQNQGIRLISAKNIENLSDIKDILIQTGQVVDKRPESELLAIFMESALLAIENRLIALGHFDKRHFEHPNTLYMAHHSQFYLPSPSTVTWELLQRLGIHLKGTSAPLCGIPLDQEHLLQLNPDRLIISCNHLDPLFKKLEQHPSLSQLKAVRDKKIFLVDQDVQQSPTQYAVLAYYDVAQALVQLDLP